MTLELILATTNAAKAVRLRALCAGVDVRIREGESPATAIAETATTHMGNAIEKALGWSRALGGVALASDGGLVIPALGDGWESTLTRRGTGEEVSDAERARRLLGRMRDLEGNRREAYWAEAVAVARDGVLVHAWETDGMLGWIGEKYRPDPNGPAGFWADGLWETNDGKKRWEASDAERAAGHDPWAQLVGPVSALLERMA